MRSTSRTARKTVLPDTIISGIPKGAHKNVNYSLRNTSICILNKSVLFVLNNSWQMAYESLVGVAL